MQSTNIISTKEVAKRTAGGDSYIRTKDGLVMGIAITKKKNTKAPSIITVTKGPLIMKNADLLAETKIAVPVYLKLGTNQWLHKGNYKVIRYSLNIADKDEYKGSWDIDDIHGILFLEKEL
tara:strand:- start:13333 stop:13695 length:363 start_codon:yes stop_codon:yes gene_type:complete